MSNVNDNDSKKLEEYLQSADANELALFAAEVRELRTCVLCSNFLDDDDVGQDLVHAEDPEEHGVLCVHCRTGQERVNAR